MGAALQLLKNIHQVLMHSNITVYLVDWSDIWYAQSESFSLSFCIVTKYYLNKGPLILIPVTAGFTLFEASKLGWDISLRATVLRSPTDNPSWMSFEVLYKVLEVGQDWYDHYWQLEMPTPPEMSQETEMFTLYQHLSISCRKAILAQAMQVWKA